MELMSLHLLLLVTCSLCAAISYDKNSLLKIKVKGPEDYERIRKIKGIRVWSITINNGSILAQIDEKNKNSVLQFLDKSKIPFDVVSNNLDQMCRNPADESTPGNFDADKFNRIDDIYTYINSLAGQNPNRANTFSIGTSHQGRQIKVIDISNNLQQRKELVIIECGSASVSWITPAACLWITKFLLSRNHPLLNYFQFRIIPVLNPDGYAYTWTNDRFWRKNRAPKANGCFGTFINRNFDIAFGGGDSSSNPCDENYRGQNAFSEKESQAIRSFFNSNPPPRYYFSFFSFGQQWMYPFGYTTNLPQDVQRLSDKANQAVNDLYSIYGTVYGTGNVAGVLGGTKSGTSNDWVYTKTRTEFAFSLLLGDTGDFGFCLPSNHIGGNGLEVIFAISEMVTNNRNMLVLP